MFVKKELNKEDKLYSDESIDCLKDRKEEIGQIGMSVTYNKNLPNINGILRKRPSFLEKSEMLKEIFKLLSIVAYKINKIMKVYTTCVYMKHINRIEGRNGSSSCGKKCAICDPMDTSDTFGRHTILIILQPYGVGRAN